MNVRSRASPAAAIAANSIKLDCDDGARAHDVTHDANFAGFGNSDALKGNHDGTAAHGLAG